MHRTYASLAVAMLTVSASACSTATMKTPAWAGEAQALQVQGYSGGFKSFVEKDIQIGSYAVTNIDRDWDKKSGGSAGPFSSESKSKAYRFDVQSQGRTVHGECSEEAEEQSIAGFGKSKVAFSCTCTEGDVERYRLELVNGSGRAQLGQLAKYEVSSVHDSEQGARISKALGYHFRGEPTEVAVDVTGTGRAWVPPSASEDELIGLVCGYAGLFLYRPTE